MIDLALPCLVEARNQRGNVRPVNSDRPPSTQQFTPGQTVAQCRATPTNSKHRTPPIPKVATARLAVTCFFSLCAFSCGGILVLNLSGSAKPF